MRGKPRNITRVVGQVVRIEYVALRKVIRFGIANTAKDVWFELSLRQFFGRLGITKRDVLDAFDLPHISKEEDADIAEKMGDVG